MSWAGCPTDIPPATAGTATAVAGRLPRGHPASDKGHSFFGSSAAGLQAPDPPPAVAMAGEQAPANTGEVDEGRLMVERAIATLQAHLPEVSTTVGERFFPRHSDKPEDFFTSGMAFTYRGHITDVRVGGPSTPGMWPTVTEIKHSAGFHYGGETVPRIEQVRVRQHDRTGSALVHAQDWLGPDRRWGLTPTEEGNGGDTRRDPNQGYSSESLLLLLLLLLFLRQRLTTDPTNPASRQCKFCQKVCRRRRCDYNKWNIRHRAHWHAEAC